MADTFLLDLILLLPGIILIVADFIVTYRREGWKYPLFIRATYIGVAWVGILFLIAVPLKPTLDADLISQLTVGGIGIALGTVGYSVITQIDLEYKHKIFEDKIKNDLQQIKTHLGITDSTQPNAVVNPAPVMPDPERQSIWFNASMLFLSLVITVATACAIAVAVLALPSDKILTGIGIEVLFILLVIIMGFFTKRWFNL